MSFSLPPGSRFYPSDHELLHCYLSNKNSNLDVKLNSYDIIKEVDLYAYEPFDLPNNVGYKYGIGGNRKHWFCYVKTRGLKENRRSTKDGCWRRSGKVKDVMGPSGNVVLGTRTRFVYYSISGAKNSVRTDWILYEYAQLDSVKDSFVLCRVFAKSRRGGNTVSENVALSCCGEESVSAVRHVGVQYDGALNPQDEGVGRNVLSRSPVNLSGERGTGFQFDSTVFPDQLVLRELDKEHLLAILEDDFIELDDLID